GGSFGGGNMFQANQSWEALSSALKLDPQARGIGAAIYGFILAVLVALVIIGGIRRIATTASRIVPFMCAIYVLGSLVIVFSNLSAVPSALADIITRAFSPTAVTGGAFGALLVGVQRAAFSNEAGVGSAPIAHSAAKTEIPVREGFVGLLEPFIDTILVCTMTGLAIVVSEAHLLPVNRGTGGAEITTAAWATVAPWFPYILALATVLFAFSTLISWSYYGERCFTWMFGARSAIAYRFIFVAFVFIGSVIKLGNVIDFSDMMILGMAFPNLLGCLLLSGKVRRDLREYWNRHRKGEFQIEK
ncbi:MAG TPA: alanine:cation symporter family protein, partial [Planctomycetota bacterium]|nr:alanine:cation symporter family protein [Planctomycetota bacterium]